MALVVNGWTLLYHPIFGRRYQLLITEARRLKERLSEDDFRKHPTVKLAASVARLIGEIIPTDPASPEFRLRGDLAKFRRAKGRGLPSRYRLVFTFSSTAKTIIYLYLNDEGTLRKQGTKNDPYEVFCSFLVRGEIGPDFDANLRAVEAEE